MDFLFFSSSQSHFLSQILASALLLLEVECINDGGFMLKDITHFTENNNFNIAEILLLDHRYLKECIKILKSDHSNKEKKLKIGRCFLDAVRKHSKAEKKAVYTAVENFEDLHFIVLEGQCEHGIIDAKVKSLIPKLTHVRALSEELEVELKVVAEILEHHIREEERDMIPKIRKDLKQSLLNEMGFEFMKLRNFTEKDLGGYPKLKGEVELLSKMSDRVSANFIAKIQGR